MNTKFLLFTGISKFLLFTGISTFVFLIGVIIYSIIYETDFDSNYHHNIPKALAETPPIHEPIEESFYLCEEGNIETRDGRIPFEEACGEGTVLQDGVCVVTLEQKSVDTFGKWEAPYQKLPPPNLRASCSFDGAVAMWFYQFIVNPLCEIGVQIIPDYCCVSQHD